MNIFKNLLTGIVIGVANIIPGVSGGTMALVLGIYERLIQSIHNISPSTLKALLSLFKFNQENLAAFKKELEKIDAYFLINIGIGAIIAIVALANLMTYLLTKQHDPTYGFFFGLVLVSVMAPYKLIKQKTVSCLIAAVIAAIAVSSLSFTTSEKQLIDKAKTKHEIKMTTKAETKEHTTEPAKPKVIRLILIFLMGIIAISAMILPGLSGSFLLLLMGGYFEILKAISNRDLAILIAFALGCGIGMLAFTRFLNFLLRKWHDLTMSSLVGLVLGSLYVIWPFKTSAIIGDETIYLVNRIPKTFAGTEISTLLTTVTGMAIVTFFIWFESKSSKIK